MHFTVIVALPFLIPFTTPLLFTAATFLLLLVYVTLPAGVALDLMVVVLPFLIVAEDFTRLNAGFLTTTLQVVFRAPAFLPFRHDPFPGRRRALYGPPLRPSRPDVDGSALWPLYDGPEAYGSGPGIYPGFSGTVDVDRRRHCYFP